MPTSNAFNIMPQKSVCVPAAPPVDISAFLPLVDHPLFQRLRERKQLGINYLVFPGAVHSRFEHALGVLGMTQRLCQIHDIRDDSRRHLCALALLHDLGHGPFSHQIEPIIGGSHNEQGIALLDEMRGELDQCGIDRQRLVRLLCGVDPLGQVVSDRNLGTDKLDYLRRDALHIGFNGAPDVDKLQAVTVLDGAVLAVQEKFIEDIKRVQKFYSYLHQHGYLNKAALALQRVLQRAVQEELLASATPATALWGMTDFELNAWLRNGRSVVAKRLMAVLDTRAFHRSALVIKPEGYGFVERQADKHLAVREWSMARLAEFSARYAACATLRDIEDRVAGYLGLAPGEALFAAMPYYEKLVPRDVCIFSSRAGGSYSLFEKDRDHHQSLQGDYLRTFAIRLVVPPAARESVQRRSAEAAAFIEAQLAAS